MGFVGTHRGPFRFFCPYCNARPGKPCVEIKGKRKGKTCKAHGERTGKFRRETYRQKDPVIWVNRVESKRSKH